jgi:Zn ribbon nucleic-acid-binding protein
MKDCRFCGAMMPFFGGDTCAACLKADEERALATMRRQEAAEEKEKVACGF